MSDPHMKRGNWIPAPHYYNLNQACQLISEAFGTCPYLVGSALETRDYRDVDIRLILDDDVYDYWFPGLGDGPAWANPRWSLLCSTISMYLSKHSDLPVDFQIQRQSHANKEYPGAARRSAIGIFLKADQPCQEQEE